MKYVFCNVVILDKNCKLTIVWVSAVLFPSVPDTAVPNTYSNAVCYNKTRCDCCSNDESVLIVFSSVCSHCSNFIF